MEYNTMYCGDDGEAIKRMALLVHTYDKFPDVVSVKNAVVLPRKYPRGSRKGKIPYQGLGGVIDMDGNFVKESGVYDLRNTLEQRQEFAFGGAYTVSKIEKSDKTAVYLGFANGHWGHFLIDVIQRLWYPLKKGLTASRPQEIDDGIDIPADYVLIYSGGVIKVMNLKKITKNFCVY